MLGSGSLVLPPNGNPPCIATNTSPPLGGGAKKKKTTFCNILFKAIVNNL